MRIDSDFDSGNIDVLRTDDPMRVELAVRLDAGGKHSQWFHFRVRGAAGQACCFCITNASKTSYPDGWEDYRAVSSTDGESWHRVPTEYVDGELRITDRPGSDEVFYAYFAPYGFDRHEALLTKMSAYRGVERIHLGQTLDGRDLASLRFNFRSVKGSEDRFTNGPTEGDDLIAAMHAMAHWPGIDNRRMAVAGYSFGAGVVLGSMSNLKTARGFAAVAPPVSAVRAMPARVGRPVLFVAGTNDRISPPVDLQRALDEVEGPVKFTELADTDHSLGGREWEAADAVAEFLATALST